ncbi:hypothetical protein DYQ86_09670 [Acidobacteria bacterium AB60]|nr:hypothetical protein DYQ86_09670 [Acidobacteria bacterium AB60]
MDLLQKRGEAPALEEACALIGHEVQSLIAKSKAEFKELCRFISDIDSDHDRRSRKRVPVCLHIAAHGNENGLGFGKDTVKWDELFDILRPLCAMRHYDGDFILVMSACGATQQRLTTHFAKKAGKALRPPAYLFTTAEAEPTFPDALVSWIVFYHQLPKVSLIDKDAIKRVLKRVKAAGTTTLKYSRWDSERKRYLQYTPDS